jgi:predicted phosphoribosyltransferase
MVRKLGVPGHEELAMGAIASGGVRVLNNRIIQSLRIPTQWINDVAAIEQAELQRRAQSYRGNQTPPEIAHKIAILVDDGLATGATMRAAAQAVRQFHPARIVVAVPVASAQSCAEFQNQVDEVICAQTPEDFSSVGAWYLDFTPTTDHEVTQLLASARRDKTTPPAEIHHAQS